MFYPMKFVPVYKDYIWGGRSFEKFGRRLPGPVTAESWDISCHRNGLSIIDNGNLKGRLLVEIIEEYCPEMLGSGLCDSHNRFPLLIKLIDANDRLSVQVHPGDEYAGIHENGEQGKNEMWYVMDAVPGARLVYDLKKGVTREAFLQAVKTGRVPDVLQEVEVFPGDVFNIPEGLVHALGAGIIIAEIQQNSDTTYRIYDYGRVDKNGNPARPLHIDRAVDVIDFDGVGRNPRVEGFDVPVNAFDTVRYLVTGRFFTVELVEVNRGFIHDTGGARFYTYTVAEGEGIIGNKVEKVAVRAGDSVLVPAAAERYVVEGRFKALRSYLPLYDGELYDMLTGMGFDSRLLTDAIAGMK